MQVIYLKQIVLLGLKRLFYLTWNQINSFMCIYQKQIDGISSHTLHKERKRGSKLRQEYVGNLVTSATCHHVHT